MECGLRNADCGMNPSISRLRHADLSLVVAIALTQKKITWQDLVANASLGAAKASAQNLKASVKTPRIYNGGVKRQSPGVSDLPRSTYKA